MAHMKLTILSATPDDATARVDYVMDGMSIGVETIPALGLAVMTKCWDDPGDMVGMSFEFEIA